jgi:DNA-binding beta-propeller fold protein YncE
MDTQRSAARRRGQRAAISIRTGIASLLWLVIVGATAALAQPSFITFESGPVRPLGLSPDGTTLFAANTPDNTLEIFDVVPGGVSHRTSVPVGMEPIAVAVRSATQVWVVNHLSDSVSVVDVGSTPPRVIRTLLVGDEPQDIVFAGPGGNRAFITTAHRGQNTTDPRGNFTTEGIGRADVWVFDATNLGAALGGTPLTVVTLFGDKPRALAVSPDGSTVYAAIFRSGNQTTSINEAQVCNTSAGNIASNTVQGPCTVGGTSRPGGSPPPHRNQQNIGRPETGLIVKFNRDGGVSNQWQDELGRNWNNAVRLSLPDLDVFAIDADAGTPVEIDNFAHVGTTLFNMVTNPVSGKLYVSNTDAQNHVRFEGPGTLASGIKPLGEPATVRGHLAESRITIIDAGVVTPRHLNKHIDYTDVPVPLGVKTASLATPVGMAVSDDGSTLYVAAFGSGVIGVFDTAALENDTFTPAAADHIGLSGGGPAGVVLYGDRLYALTRFNNSVVTVDLTLGAVGTEIQSVALHNPEPASVVDGRPFLYDAVLTSSNGEAACASCHIFGDNDDLAWDLGNPDDIVVANGNPFTIGSGAPFHPMKGPMTTQSLRGMVEMGPQHWRGDRQGDSTDAFNAFNVAFPGLVGRDEGEFSAAEMQQFTDFALQITYPPNPIRQLDNTLRSDEAAGLARYNGAPTDGGVNCNGCHTLDQANGFFGGNGNSSIEGETQEFKIPHLRNVYQKVGMFGLASTPGLDGSFAATGDQVRGYGLLHDGAIDTVRRFLNPTTFSITSLERDNLQAFMMAFDTDLPPMVGQQITRTSSNGATVDPRINAMLTAAGTSFVSKLLGPTARQCDVIVKGTVGGEARGYVRLVASGQFRSDRAADALLAEATLRGQSAVAGQELTYTCVPFGSGERMGIDRDLDTYLDRDELDAGSDPADPLSIPAGTTAVLVPGRKLLVKNASPDDEAKNKIVLLLKDAAITTPAPDSADDPRCGASPSGTVKASLQVFSPTSGESHTANLPCQNWSLIGSASNPKGYKYRDSELNDGTVKTAIWKNGSQLKATLQGKGASTLDYDLQVGVSQGSVAATFSNGATTLCASFPPYNGKDGSDGRSFLSKNAPAPPSCPTP